MLFDDFRWDASDASHFSAWLQPMLVTNPKARATAAQSAHHPFLEPLYEDEVEEGEMLGTSSSGSSCSSSKNEGVLEEKVKYLEEQLGKIEARCVGEISKLETKLGQVAEAKDTETKLLSKLKAEVSDLKAEKEAEKTEADNLKQRLGNLESKFDELEAENSVESEHLPRPAVASSPFISCSDVADFKNLKANKAQLKGEVKTCKQEQERDFENNAKADKVTVKAEVEMQSTKKKSLMQIKLNLGKDVTGIKSRACHDGHGDKQKVKTAGEVAGCTQLVISNIKLPCSIIAQTRLLCLVKKTGTMVKYRFSEHE